MAYDTLKECIDEEAKMWAREKAAEEGLDATALLALAMNEAANIVAECLVTDPEARLNRIEEFLGEMLENSFVEQIENESLRCTLLNAEEEECPDCHRSPKECDCLDKMVVVFDSADEGHLYYGVD
jgi:hypothetical protein